MANSDTAFDWLDTEELVVKPPIAVLKEYALALERKTKGLLVGEIRQDVMRSGGFMLTFHIMVPSLNNYRCFILRLKHDIFFYPVFCQESNINIINLDKRMDDVYELENFLNEIFSSSEVKRLISGLLTQIRAA